MILIHKYESSHVLIVRPRPGLAWLLITWYLSDAKYTNEQQTKSTYIIIDFIDLKYESKTFNYLRNHK